MEKISNELHEIIKKMEAQGKVNFKTSATEEQIKEFENKHNIALPKKYKEWLLFSDGGECYIPAGIQLYGVISKPLIELQNDDGISDDYIVIGALPQGDPIIFKNNHEHISIYNLETGKIEKDETFDDFFEFLRNLYEILY